ncbi:hypothetical protein TeGR_g2285 [Tetraparma gracilis]|uniref:sphinganine-1-phosphate aldolase n=1 Tax=Tetraparma gracilis TaxID=2962635 RepID=A0ABQ6MYV3_9STRA|nr:hypothetical protein TeGR_g2285 [Tetraparma gracilis]
MSSALFKQNVVELTREYISPALASHFEWSMDSPAHTITTIVLLLTALTAALAAAPPRQRVMRDFRGVARVLSALGMVYRFVTVMYLPSYAIEHDLFDYTISALQSFYTTLEFYTSLHLPAKLSSALMTCFRDLVGLAILRMIYTYLQSYRRTTFKEWKVTTTDRVFRLLKANLSVVRAELQKEEDKMEKSLTEELKDAKRKRTIVLPRKGRAAKTLMADFAKRGKAENKKWEDGLVSGAVYCGEKEHTELLSAAYAAFSLANPLHPDIWPSVNQFEAEIVSMCCNMMNGQMNGTKGDLSKVLDAVCGCISSGGTESIFLATKAHRELYCKSRGIKHPEVISCVTAHAAIDKACEILNIRHVRVPYKPNSYKIDVDAVKAAMSSDTIMIYSSAPTFPQGVIDDIPALGKIALEHDVGLHVDCCLGGFVLPFAKKQGYDIPEFDFTVPGVTTMSCDTHKYGYASKGTSVVMYHDKELRRCQYFCYPEWTGGLYVTPTLAGSRPGALSAACWASMMAMGEEGYTERVIDIMDTTQWIAEMVNNIEGLYLLGDPKSMIVCFDSKQFNIYRVGDKMAKKGWSLNSLQKPSCIHMCVTLRTVEHSEKFVDDLTECVEEVLEEGNDGKLTGNAAVYGMSGSMPPGPVNELLCCYTDTILKA